MQRREFITLLGGAAAAWPLGARAQQDGRVRRVGVLLAFDEVDPEAQAVFASMRQGLRELGWIEGRNLQMEVRWASGDSGRLRVNAAELVGMMPDIIFVNGSRPLMEVLRESRSVPTVFAEITDPVAQGFVQSLARPGGSSTGFTLFDGPSAIKLLEALKEIAPDISWVGLMLHPDNPAVAVQMQALESAAPKFAAKPVATLVRTAVDIERTFESLASVRNSGLIVPPDANNSVHRSLIVSLAAKYRLPAVYSDRPYVIAGGLMSYGPDRLDLYYRAASYVDRILKGAKPADLPVQQPTKYQFVLNLKTAKALGLDVPTSIFLRAGEVIE
jgi:putative ABC transport system substrate-binding protein